MNNWDAFFSAFAQSVASVVGVTAAFVIAKLIDAQAEFARARARTDELLVDAERLRDAAASRSFEWLIRQTLSDALSAVRKQLKEPVKSPGEYYRSVRFPIFLAHTEAIKAIEETIETWRLEVEADAREAERKAALRKFPGASIYGLSGLDLPRMPPVSNTFLEAAREREINEEGDQIDALVVEVKHHIRLIQQHLNSVAGDPQKSNLVTGVIWASMLLFVTGIVYPLSFLPAASTGPPRLGGIDAFLTILLSLRGVLLLLLSLVFGGLLHLLHRANARLVHPPHRLNALVSAVRLGYYSEFLQIMEENANWADFIKMKQRQHKVGQVPPEVLKEFLRTHP